MVIKRQIENIRLREHSVIDLLLTILSSNDLYRRYIQRLAEQVANEKEVSTDE